MLKRKRTKGSGSQAPVPEGRPEREAPVEQLWERSWEGRKETNRKPSTRNRKDGMGNQAGHKGRNLGSVSGTEAPGKPAVRRRREGKWKGRTDRLSSEMLKRKRTKGSGSQAPVPEEKSKREAPVEQLWERSREGRKETNRKLSMRSRMKRTGNQPWMKGRSDGDERNRSLDGKPTVRRNGQRAERKKQRPSSRKGSGRDRKGTEAERKIPEARAEGKHLTSSCGSESGKGERKHTARLSTGNRERGHGKPGRKERGKPQERK